jgi:hypothetical protein
MRAAREVSRRPAVSSCGGSVGRAKYKAMARMRARGSANRGSSGSESNRRAARAWRMGEIRRCTLLGTLFYFIIKTINPLPFKSIKVSPTHRA